MRLVPRDVGPIGKAELNLSGVVLLYGPHGAGSTTVARALSVAFRLLGGPVEAREATSLINCGAEKAVIELEEYAVELGWGYVTAKTGAVLEEDRRRRLRWGGRFEHPADLD